MQILLFVIVIAILGYNFIIGILNLSRIVTYCWYSNSLDEYWSLFFKSGLSLRAIISSVISILLAVIIYIILVPLMLTRKSKPVQQFQQNKFEKNIITIPYSEENAARQKGKEMFTNSELIGLTNPSLQFEGDLKIDAFLIYATLLEFFKENDIEAEVEPMQKFMIKDNKKVIAHLRVASGNKIYPCFLLYKEEDIIKFKEVKTLLADAGYSSVVYFAFRSLEANRVAH